MFENTRKFDYFNSFIELAQLALNMAELLEQMIDNYPQQRISKYRDPILGYQAEAYGLVDLNRDHLKEDFIPPIDREDIYILSQNYLAIIDSLGKIYDYYYIFQFDMLRPEILDCTRKLKDIVGELVALSKQYQDFKRLKSIGSKIQALRQGIKDQYKLYRQVMYMLFQPGRDLSPRELLSYTKLFDTYGQALESIDTALIKMEEILIKDD